MKGWSRRTRGEVLYRSMSQVLMNYVLLKLFQFPLFPEKSHSTAQKRDPHSPLTDKKMQKQ